MYLQDIIQPFSPNQLMYEVYLSNSLDPRQNYNVYSNKPIFPSYYSAVLSKQSADTF